MPPAAPVHTPGHTTLSARELLLLAALTLIWGLNWPVMKMGVQDFAPITFRVLSMFMGVAVLGSVALLRRMPLRVERQHWPELFWLSCTNMAGWALLSVWGVRAVSSGRAAILAFTMPIWASLIGWLVFRQRATPRLAVGTAAAAAGIALLLAGDWQALGERPAGTLCLLLAALVWATGTHLTRRRKQRTSPAVLVFWSLAVSTALCAPLALAFEHSAWQRAPTAIEWASMLYNALLVYSVAQVIWIRLASALPPMASGLCVMLVPAVGLFSGMALLGEVPGWQDLAALVCILLSMAAVLLPARAGASRLGMLKRFSIWKGRGS